MVSQAAIEGIKENGIKWKYKLKLNISSSVKDLLSTCESSLDILTTAHVFVKQIITKINKFIKFLDPSQEDLKCELEHVVESLQDTFVYDNIDSLKDWKEADLAYLAEGTEEELIYQLNALFDICDYYRVLVN